MIPKRPVGGKAKRRKLGKSTGNRRRIPLDERGCGWRHRHRTKVSAYAEKGFKWEVRLEHYRAWDDVPKDATLPGCALKSKYDVVLDQIKNGTDCRIVGRHGQWIDNGYTKRNIRIYFKTDTDLFYFRLIHDSIFRLYRLVAPSP